MTVTSVMAVVTVADFDAGIAWSERFLGARPTTARSTASPSGGSPMEASSSWFVTWIERDVPCSRSG